MRESAGLLTRTETAADRHAVQALITAAFRRADHDAPVAETVLNDRLRAEPAWRPELTLVAEMDGVLVGQLTSSNGTVESRDESGERTTVVAIGPVAVRPGHQRAGIGSALLRDVIVRALDAGEPMLVLLGSPDFYGRFGFVPASDVRIEAPDPQWGRHFQVRPLRDDAPLPTGRFRYAPPFDLV